jgi:hypothetical protein
LGVEGVVRLAAGSHTIAAELADYRPDQREITVVGGTPQTVSLTLTPLPRTGHVTIQSAQPGAHVAIDGHDIGAAPVDVDLSAGGHHLDVAAPGFVTNRSELAVAIGQQRTMMIALEPPPPPPESSSIFQRWWFWAGVGVVAVGVGTFVLWPRTQGPLTGTLGQTNTNP